MDQLAAMRTFVAIVEHGSLTAAAEHLGRSVPAVVRALARLESHLGARLLRRTTRRMSLTDEGRAYVQRCRTILADVAEAEREVGRGQRQLRGSLRVTAPVLFGERHLAPALTAFLHQHAGVQAELLLLDRVVDLVEEGIDVALRIGELPDSTLVAVPLGHMRRVLCASPELLARHGRPDHPAALARLPCVLFRGLMHGSVWHFDDGGRERSVRVSGALVCNQAAVAARACADGLGFASLLAYQVEEYLRRGELEVVLADFEPAPRPVSLVYPAGRAVSARLRALVEHLRASVGQRLAALQAIGVATAGH